MGLYTVDPQALATAAPAFDVIAQDCVQSGRDVVDATSSMVDALGDPAVVTSVGAVVTALLSDLQLVHAGLTELGVNVKANGDGYVVNEQSTAASYARAHARLGGTSAP